MRALVVYESMFGNTRYVAEAIADGLGATVEVELVGIQDAPEVLDHRFDLVVVGGPTHAFGMSRPSTRRDAVTKYGAPPTTPTGSGIRDWIDRADAAAGLAFATFDTRLRRPRLPGSAARAARTRLRRRGLRPIAGSESFWVAGTDGPLLPGETERARRWGGQLAALVTGSSAGSANSR